MRPQLETVHFLPASPSIKYFAYKNPDLKPYWHHHPEVEISYMIKGKGLRYVGDAIQSFEEGELLLLGESLPHDSISKNEGPEDYKEVLVLQFSKNIFQSFPECKPLSQLCEDAQYGFSYNNPSSALVKKIVSLGELKPLQKLISLLGILNLMDADKNRKTLSSISFAQNPMHGKFQKNTALVTQYILNHLDKPLSLNQIATFSGMTPNSFCRWFKKSNRSNFITYLNTARIERACQYLVETDWKSSEIAYKTGFENISHFNRIFKKVKQQSPSSYRKSIIY
jgi:AraC-like DNA-binding protein